MRTQSFDTLSYAKQLIAGGFTEQQAEAQAVALRTIIDDNLASKRDVLSIQKEIETLRSDLTRDVEASRSDLSRYIEAVRLELKRDIAELRADLMSRLWLQTTITITVLGGVMGLMKFL